MSTKTQILLLSLVVSFVLMIPTIGFTHPGRTASDGCHYCRTNCDSWGVAWNQRHCHGGPTLSTPPPSIDIDEEPTDDVFARVTRVIDGDTIEVEVVLPTAGLRKIRFIGIDTPETVHPSKPVQCFGKEASAKMKELVDGKTVRLEIDPVGDTIDTYGRWLRLVYVDDLFVNLELVKQGYAYAYTKYPFSQTYMDLFVQAEKEAMQNQRGLWEPGVCDVPSSATRDVSPGSSLPSPRSDNETATTGDRVPTYFYTIGGLVLILVAFYFGKLFGRRKH